MIKLIDNLVALPNNMGFTVAEDKNKTDKNGNQVYSTIAYCGNLEEVLWTASQYAARTKLSGDDVYSVREAIDVLKEIKDMISKALEGLE